MSAFLARKRPISSKKMAHDSQEFFYSKAPLFQWSLHPLRFPRYRGTETPQGEDENTIKKFRGGTVNQIINHTP